MASVLRRGEIELSLPGGVERFECRIGQLEQVSEYEPKIYDLFKRLCEDKTLADTVAVLDAVTLQGGASFVETHGLLPAAECAAIVLGNGLGIDQEDASTAKKPLTRPSIFAALSGRVRLWVGGLRK